MLLDSIHTWAQGRDVEGKEVGLKGYLPPYPLKFREMTPLPIKIFKKGNHNFLPVLMYDSIWLQISPRNTEPGKHWHKTEHMFSIFQLENMKKKIYLERNDLYLECVTDFDQQSEMIILDTFDHFWTNLLRQLGQCKKFAQVKTKSPLQYYKIHDTLCGCYSFKACWCFNYRYAQYPLISGVVFINVLRTNFS